MSTWLRAATANGDAGLARRGTPTHRPPGLGHSTPATRVIEVTRERNELAGYLQEAAQTVERLDRDRDRFTGLGNNSFGRRPIAQSLVDLWLWEAILNDNVHVRGVIEIGSWQGGFSWWMSAQAKARDILFATYDVVEPTLPPPDGFQKIDVFADPDRVKFAVEAIGEPLILFCDGGNKPRELATFAPMVENVGSLIAVHDWGTETTPADVPDGLVEVYGAQCDDLGSITRWFRPQPAWVT